MINWNHTGLGGLTVLAASRQTQWGGRMWGCTYSPAAHKDWACDQRDEPVGPQPPLPMDTSRQRRRAAVSPSALPVGFTSNVFVSCVAVDGFTGSASCQTSVGDHKVAWINSLAAVMSFWLARRLGGWIPVSYQLPLAEGIRLSQARPVSEATRFSKTSRYWQLVLCIRHRQ